MSRLNAPLLRAFLLIASISIALPAVSFAQSASEPDSEQDHSAHHIKTQTPAAPPSSTMPMGTETDKGAAGSNDMMQMMTMMRGMMSMMGAAGGMMSSHVEDRIAALKEELKPTSAQLPQWNQFAKELGSASHSMADMYQQIGQQGAASLPQRLEEHRKMLESHLASLNALEGASDALYQVLTETQKKVMDGMMLCPMGMM